MEDADQQIYQNMLDSVNEDVRYCTSVYPELVNATHDDDKLEGTNKELISVLSSIKRSLGPALFFMHLYYFFAITNIHLNVLSFYSL